MKISDGLKSKFELSYLFTTLSVRAVYNELHNTLMAIDEQEDLRWWKNTYGPGMPTEWPHFQVFFLFWFLSFKLTCLSVCKYFV